MYFEHYFNKNIFFVPTLVGKGLNRTLGAPWPNPVPIMVIIEISAQFQTGIEPGVVLLLWQKHPYLLQLPFSLILI